MKYASKITREYHSNFMIDESKIRRLLDIVYEYYLSLNREKPTIKFYAEREDDVQFETKHVDDLIKDENINGKEIIKLAIASVKEGDSYYSSKEIEIVFVTGRKNSWRDSGVYIKIDLNDRNSSFVLMDKIESQLQRILSGASNSIINKILRIIDAIFPILVSFLILLVINKLNNSFLLNRTGDSPLYLLIISLMISSTGMFFTVINVFDSDFLFLTEMYNKIKVESAFYWGEKMKEYKRKKRLINNIVWVIIIGSIMSLATGILTHFLLI